MKELQLLTKGIPLDPFPDHPGIDPSVPHAPRRPDVLSASEKATALQNALRYFPSPTHPLLAPEFAHELKEYGHIYMYRFRPTQYSMKSYDINLYPVRCKKAAAIIVMIMNNLDPSVAQFPHELITYGGNGSVLQNWAQYHLLMKYLSTMSEEQTLVMYSGHPMGLYPSSKDAPLAIITNGMVIPNYSSQTMYEKMYALGVSMYGQMTAGSYCYIGPQGIVHGTTITLLQAGRKYLSSTSLAGKVFVTSGLGGMSGAQAKAAVICGAVGVIAEVNLAATTKRHSQGWVNVVCNTLPNLMTAVKKAISDRRGISIAYNGNIVDLWEYLVAHPDDSFLPELGSDQTSLHNPFLGGYYPVQLSFEAANEMMSEDPAQFKHLVQESLVRHAKAVNTLTARGMRFWDYGNSFLLQASKAGADVMAENGTDFRYPSYVQDIMGDVFSLGFGPFRWVCTSCDPKDLELTDKIAAEIIAELKDHKECPDLLKQQYEDNHTWIRQADEHKLVVGSQARILYSDGNGRIKIAQAFNDAVSNGKLKGPVVISRDHHDVSGTDSPYRETSNITDGSKFCADMAVQNFTGDSFRGATWVSLHNGGGVGWGEVTNGGFGMVLDGSDDMREKAAGMLFWDVNNGVSRRAWAFNENALFTIKRAMQENPNLLVTLPSKSDGEVIQQALKKARLI